VLSSGGVAGLVAGIEAGLGVSILPKNALSGSRQDVGELYGLPDLPPFEYRLFESQFATPAARRLAFAIKEVFGQEQAQHEVIDEVKPRYPQAVPLQAAEPKPWGSSRLPPGQRCL
jgi:hypothetical protein